MRIPKNVKLLTMPGDYQPQIDQCTWDNGYDIGTYTGVWLFSCGGGPNGVITFNDTCGYNRGCINAGEGNNDYCG